MGSHEVGIAGETALSWDVVADAAQAMVGAAARMSETLKEGATALSQQAKDLIETRSERDELRAALAEAEASWVSWRVHAIGLLDMVYRLAGALKEAEPDHRLFAGPRGFDENERPLDELARGWLAAAVAARLDIGRHHSRAAAAYDSAVDDPGNMLLPIVSAGLKCGPPYTPELWDDVHKPMTVSPSPLSEKRSVGRDRTNVKMAEANELIFDSIVGELSVHYEGSRLRETLKALKELSPQHKLLRNLGRFSTDGRPLNELEAKGILATLRCGRAMRSEYPTLNVQLEFDSDKKVPIVVASLFGASRRLNFSTIADLIKDVGVAEDAWISPEHEALAEQNERLQMSLQEKDKEIVKLRESRSEVSYRRFRAETHWRDAIRVIEYDAYVTAGHLAQIEALSKALKRQAPEHDLFRKTNQRYRNGQQKKVIRRIYEAGFEDALCKREGGRERFHGHWYTERDRLKLLSSTPPDLE